MSSPLSRAFHHRWTTLGLFALLSLVCYVDSFVLGALITPIKETLHTTDEQLGRLSLVTTLVYIVVLPLAGYAGDRFRRKWYIFFSLLVWSAATVGSGLATSFHSLLFWRALVGAGEGVFSGLAPGWLADIFPSARRSLVFAVLMSTSQVAAWVAYYFGGLIAAEAGWHQAFFIAGVPGLALLLFVPFLREPRRGEADGLTPAELSHPTHAEIWALFKNPAYLLYLLGYTLRMVAVTGLFFWGAVFLHRQYGVVNREAVSFIGATYLLTGAPGIFLAGYFAGKLALRFRGSYAFWLVGGELLASLAVLSLLLTLPDLRTVKILFLIQMFFAGNSWGSIRPLLFEFAPVATRNIAVSVSMVAQFIGSAFLGSELIGFASDHFGITQALFLVPISYFAAALVWAALGLWQVRTHGRKIESVEPIAVPQPVL